MLLPHPLDATQPNDSSKSDCALMHARARQFPKHSGSPMLQPTAQKSVSEQLATPHGPQSAGHAKQLSPISVLHVPSPQPPGHGPQSRGQRMQSSPSIASHTPSPQLPGHGPQSTGQLSHVSI